MITGRDLLRFLFDKVLREDESFQLGDSAIGGTKQVGQYDRNIELEGAGELTPRLDSLAGEDKLAHLGTEHHPQHGLLDEGTGATNVRTGRDYHFTFIAWVSFCSVFLPLRDVDVAMLNTWEIFTKNKCDHLLPEHRAGKSSQPAVDVLLQDLQHPSRHPLHQVGLALGEGDVGHHLVLKVLEVGHHTGVLKGLRAVDRFPQLLIYCVSLLWEISTFLATMVEHGHRFRKEEKGVPSRR